MFRSEVSVPTLTEIATYVSNSHDDKQDNIYYDRLKNIIKSFASSDESHKENLAELQTFKECSPDQFPLIIRALLTTKWSKQDVERTGINKAAAKSAKLAILEEFRDFYLIKGLFPFSNFIEADIIDHLLQALKYYFEIFRTGSKFSVLLSLFVNILLEKINELHYETVGDFIEDMARSHITKEILDALLKGTNGGKSLGNSIILKNLMKVLVTEKREVALNCSNASKERLTEMFFSLNDTDRDSLDIHVHQFVFDIVAKKCKEEDLKKFPSAILMEAIGDNRYHEIKGTLDKIMRIREKRSAEKKKKNAPPPSESPSDLYNDRNAEKDFENDADWDDNMSFISGMSKFSRIPNFAPREIEQEHEKLCEILPKSTKYFTNKDAGIQMEPYLDAMQRIAPATSNATGIKFLNGVNAIEMEGEKYFPIEIKTKHKNLGNHRLLGYAVIDQAAKNTVLKEVYITEEETNSHKSHLNIKSIKNISFCEIHPGAQWVDRETPIKLFTKPDVPHSKVPEHFRR